MQQRNATILILAAGMLAAVLVLRRSPQPPQGPSSDEIRETMTAYFRHQRQALDSAARGWDSAAASAFTLHMAREGFAAKRVSQYRSEVDSAIQHALKMLGESSYAAHLQVYYVASREEMKVIVGGGYTGSTDPEAHTVVFVASDSARPAHRHEIMHAVSLLIWGQPGSADGDASYPVTPGLFARGGWLREGIAAAAEDRCGTYTYTAIAAQMHEQGERLPLDTLMSAFYELDDLASYLQAGSLVNYLLATYGIDPFRRLWRSAGTDFQSAYGKRASVIEGEWRHWLSAVPESERPPSMQEFRKQGCT